jgi:DNA-binding NarL/FixJ family response regulator
VRVIVAEDVLLTREGLVRLLAEAGVTVVAAVGDADALLREVDRLRPDVAIVDIRLPPTHSDEGLIAVSRIRRAYPDVGALILSQYVEPGYALRLLQDQSERMGYLLKERVLDVATLTDALRRISAGETVIDPSIVGRLMGRTRRNSPLAGLTQREREVLGAAAEGLSNKGIAARLFVTERTVEAHLTQIFSKLDIPHSELEHRRILAVLTYLRS